MTILIWLVPVTIFPIIESIPVHDLSTRARRNLVYFLYYLTFLFFISICYFSIYLKIRCSRLPQPHGAIGLRERKLTSALFLVTLGSFLTLLPVAVFWGLVGLNTELVLSLSFQSQCDGFMAIIVVLMANSVLNPIIYAIRMPEIRASVLQLLFCRASNRVNQADIPIQGL